jgi:hypothetical protein
MREFWHGTGRAAARARRVRPGQPRPPAGGWAEGQHGLHEDIGLGLNDTEYAEAMRYASVPTDRERRAEELARVLNDPPPVPGSARAFAAQPAGGIRLVGPGDSN